MSFFKSWSVGDEIPTALAAWKEALDVRDRNTMLLEYVIPKLQATLREDRVRIDPHVQNMQSLEQVLQWAEIISPSTFSQLLETEFFPKWLDILYFWLIQPRISFEEVAQWYSFWKGSFPEYVRALPGIDRGFARGLQLLNKAIELGPDASTQLARPDTYVIVFFWDSWFCITVRPRVQLDFIQSVTVDNVFLQPRILM